jgi:hypothetical protein
MRRGLFCGVAGFLLVAACSSPPSTQVHHAYVVVQHLNGSWFERHIDFTSADIDGVAAMDRSGLEYQAQSVSTGKVVCQVDNEPSSFTLCFPQNKPYWALFVAAGGKWSSAQGGLSEVKLHDGQAIGWHYVPAGDPSPAPPPMPREL